MHAEPSAKGRSAPAAIVAGRAALARPATLIRAGIADAEVEELAAGPAPAIERWDSPDGPYYTLTPLGAEIAGVSIDERVEGVPVWVEQGKESESVRLRGRPGERQLARPDLVRAPASAPDPEDEAIVRECAELIARFEADPGAPGAMELIRRAESIVEGVTEAMQARYLWDEASGLPRLIRGRLVPRDVRMGPGKVG
jgi:hypothetical protein